MDIARDRMPGRHSGVKSRVRKVIMQSPPPLSSPDRLAVLGELLREEHSPGRSFSHLARLAAHILHAPIALVSFVDGEREYIESSTGIPARGDEMCEIALDDSLCSRLVAGGEPLLIEDARREEWARGLRAVREWRAVAFAGVPIRTRGGHVLGAFCVIDHIPRSWVAEEAEILQRLAGAVQEEIEERLALRGEQREAEKAARKFEEELGAVSRFRTVVESSLAGIYLLQDDRIVYANPRLKKLFGYAPHEPLTGRPITDFVVEEDRAQILENVRRRLRGEGEEMPYTFRGLRKDGSVVDIEVHGSLTEIDGSPAIIGTLLDITRRRRAEEALRENEERLRLVERATEDVIWDWDVRTGAVGWNESGPKMFRYRPEEVGATIEWHHEHIHPEDRERVIRSLQMVLSGVGEYWSDEYRFRRGDGHYATVLDRGYVQRNGRGEPVRVIGSMMDVTERKREEEAQRFLSRASMLLDSSLDHEPVLASLARLCVPVLGDYCIIDLVEGGRDFRRVAVSHVDPRAEDLLLREAGEANRRIPKGHPVARVQETGDSIFLPACDDASLEQLGYTPEEREALRKPGTCSVIIVPLAVGERRLGALSVGLLEGGRSYTPVDLMLVQDLAHRTALAIDHARLYQQATAAIRARDEVLGVVSHDLRNPLSAIQMSVAMIRDQAQERRSENQRWLDMILRTSNQMSALIDDLLDVSSIEAGHFSVDPSSSSVAELTREACELLKPLAEEKGIHFSSEIAEGLSAVWIDSHQILRVLSNLVGNAVKFTPEGGRVALRVEPLGTEVLFSVSDTGPGIPPEQLPHVFDRYWQARPGDRRGAGLGLTISQGIVEAHGGRIWVESAAGGGASFSFTVPVGGRSRAASGAGSRPG